MSRMMEHMHAPLDDLTFEARTYIVQQLMLLS